MRARHWVVLSAVAAVATAGWWWWQGPSSGVVNDDHVLHLLVGTAWVCAALAARGPLGRLAAHRWARPGVHLLGQRSLTIYLWHTTAIVVALWALERWGLVPGPAWAVAYAAAIAVGVAAAVVAFGWLEDRAARRRAILWPRRRAGRPAAGWSRSPRSASRLLVVVLVLATVPLGRGGRQVAAFEPPVPSQAPPPPGGGGRDRHGRRCAGPRPGRGRGPRRRPAAVAVRRGRRPPGPPGDPGRLGRASTGSRARWRRWSWRTGRRGRARSGSTTVGCDSIEDPVEAMSITKLFTANLVYRLVDAGLIGLDDPLPPLDALPGFPLTGEVTIRQLLSHRTPLLGYRDTAAYAEDPAAFGDPATASAGSAARRSPASRSPSRRPPYSSTNYLVLGYPRRAADGHLLRPAARGAVLRAARPLRDLPTCPRCPASPASPPQGSSGRSASWPAPARRCSSTTWASARRPSPR